MKAAVVVVLLILGVTAGVMHYGALSGLLLAAAVLVSVLSFAWWAFIPSRELPRNRIRNLRTRLHLRLYPGPGFTTAPGLWLQWGRFAAYRHSHRIRSMLPRWYRLTTPDSHSVHLGRAQYRHRLRTAMDEHVVVFSPPRKGKSGWMARVINHYPGAVLSTTTKADVFNLTSGLRAGLGPIEALNPQGIGGVPSTFTFDPLGDCTDPTVAIRRADSFAGGINTKGVENGDFWRKKAGDYFRAMFCAAALAGLGIQDVSDWVLTGGTEYAEAVLTQAGYAKWAAQLAELRTGAEKTTATIKITMSSALGFLNDPRLAASVVPGGAFGLDIPGLIRSRGTLYMIADQQGEEAPLAPLFACLANEVHFQASMLASEYPDGHLDPPLGMFLDEVTQICPVPVPTWAADSGGKGIQLFIVAHGQAQFAGRWGEHSARIILDTAGTQVFLPGITAPDTLDLAEKLCGTFPGHERGSEHVTRHHVMDAAMVRALPSKYALVLRSNLLPVIARMPMAWRDLAYLRAKFGGRAVAPVVAVAMPEPQLTVPAAAHEPGDFPWRTPGPGEIPAGAPVPAAVNGAATNGHARG